jgi:hypothetical protein
VNVEAFKAAARAAIVMPSVFAFASLVIGRPQVSLFAAFGSFAVLVLVEFGGTRRARLAAYAGFAAAGVGLIALGTLCSRDPLIAAAAMAVVVAILFSGGFSGYLAAAATARSCLRVAGRVAPNSAIPDRLFGWLLAAGVGTAAASLWPPRRRAACAAAAAVRSVVDLIEAGTRAGRTERNRRETARSPTRSFGSQHRPAGPPRDRRPRASHELDWLLLPRAKRREDVLRPGRTRSWRPAPAAAAAFSRAPIELDAKRHRGLRGLDAAQHDLVVSIKQLLSGPDMSPTAARRPELARSSDCAAASAARQLAVNAMRAGRMPPDDKIDARRIPRSRPPSNSPRTRDCPVGVQNSRARWRLRSPSSSRSASGSSTASGSFSGLSVLRSNALGTGWSIVSAP